MPNQPSTGAVTIATTTAKGAVREFRVGGNVTGVIGRSNSPSKSPENPFQLKKLTIALQNL